MCRRYCPGASVVLVRRCTASSDKPRDQRQRKRTARTRMNRLDWRPVYTADDRGPGPEGGVERRDEEREVIPWAGRLHAH